ncbi:MAG: DsbA family protein, partial [Lysobacterales bacterium]
MYKLSGFSILILLVFAISTTSAVAKVDNADLQQEMQALKQGQEQIQKDLAEIKKLLQQGARAPSGQRAFKPTDTKMGDVAYLGDFEAPVTLIEFSDYHCPFCKRHATTVLNQLSESYIDTGKVRYVMREFPIPNLHPRAEAASKAALCAGEQGAYWAMHDALFNDQKATTDEAFQSMAGTLGLDVEAFSTCLAGDKFDEQIKADKAEGQKYGITGTPSFVMGLTDPDDPDTVHLTKYIRGAQPYATFSAAIDEL